MTDEEIEQKFAEVYPDFEFRGLPLSPYFDIWCYAIEIMEQETDKLLDVINGQDVKIADLEKSVNNWLKYEKETQYHKSIIKDLKKENKILEGCLLAEQEHTQILEQQIEKMKCCGNCKNQLSLAYGELTCDLYGECKHYSKWELKE